MRFKSDGGESWSFFMHLVERICRISLTGRIMAFFCVPFCGDLLGGRRGKLWPFLARLFAVIHAVSTVIGGDYGLFLSTFLNGFVEFF